MNKKVKYGFVYIWYDRKHHRYYIGCHWGTIDDGYICSSNWTGGNVINEKGEKIAWISYNGRVWDLDGKNIAI